MQPIIRPIAYQTINTVIVAIGITPTPLLPTQNKTDYIDSFVLSLDANAANNIFIGDGGVTVNSGLEIVAGGGPINFIIRNQHMQYDQLTLESAMVQAQTCLDIPPQAIPFIIWDLTQVFGVAAAPTNVRLAPFRALFV